ncbi:MAG: SusC/RagA family TonB-linked outer membrane protein [Crocinitomicaceae bacterium]|nr:SusC/RagA family TonB-linked outer membrane protein [Crocinitomicaceae bacterium]
MKQTIKQVCGVLLFTLFSFSGFAQKTDGEKIITGNVIDNTGLGLPGVNVIEKGSKKGVATDMDGRYVITVKNDAVLVFAYVGMIKQEIKVGNSSVVNVTMKEDASELEAVVVVGYGQQKKIHLTSAVETAKMGEIENLPTGDIGAALAGRIIGVGVSGGYTRPGTKSTLKIRNPMSTAKDGGTTAPLYVIDGVLQIAADGTNDTTLFDNMDSSEVESISFLKDGAAVVYGARAAQGVVVITTKRGKIGTTKFSYSGSYGANDEAFRTKMMTAYDFGNYINIANGVNGANRGVQTDYNFSPDELEYFKTLNYNPLEDEWKPSFNSRHNLNVSGGSDKATYFAGASYYTQNGNLSTLDYDKWTYRAGADVNISSNLKAGLQVSGFYSDKTKTFNKVGGENDENDYRTLLTALPYIPQYINDMAVQENTSNALTQYHYGEVQRLGNLATTTSSTMTLNMFAEYNVPFVKGMKLRGSYARNMGNARGTQVGTSYKLYQFAPNPDPLLGGVNGHIFNESSVVKSSSIIKNGDRLYYDNSNSMSTQYNFTASYNRDFGKHSFSGLFSIEKSEAESTKEVVFKEGVLESTNGQFGSAFGAISGSTARSESGSLGYIGRFNYAYGDKYLAEFLYRSDASTKFAPEYYWGNFYSLSAGWVISKEDFFKSSVIDFLKVRYSIGHLGKDDTKAWQWRQRYTYQEGKGIVTGDTNNNVNSSTGMKMEVSPNPDAHWSDEIKTNFGLEMKFLDDRLSFTGETYYNIGTNVLMENTGNVPFTVGGSVAAENFGSIDTFGYELSLGWSDRVATDFSYGVDLRFGWSDNKVVKGNFNAADILLPWTQKPGESSDNGVWGYDNLGMFKTQADVDAYVSQNKITQVFGTVAANLRPGMLYYRDVRGAYLGNGEFAAPDGIINVNDQIQLAKKASTKYGMGTTLRVAYKSFSINTVVNASFGGGWSEVDSQTRKPLNNQITRNFDSRPEIWNNIYDPELNPNGVMPNPYWTAINLDPTSTFWSRDPFRIECRNITLAYKFTERTLNSLKISNCALNLVVLNPFNLYNPFGYKNPSGAYDTYPSLRTVSLGLNIGF